MKQQGIDVLAFTAGEPDFDTPDFAKAAAIEAIHAGYTKYTATPGIPELREAISEKFWRDNHLRYSPDQIVVSCGAKHSIFNALMALVDPGDEVIIPSPCWVSYPEQVKLMGGVPVIAPTEESNDFAPYYDAIRELITPRTKVLMLNSPCNPTGAVYSRQTLKEIAALAIKHNFWVIADEIYEKLIYEGHSHTSIAALGSEIYERVITINGLSKSHAMTGWRIGYAAAPLKVAKAMICLQDQMTSNACSIAQYAALGALQGPAEWYDTMRQRFDARRKRMVEGLNQVPGIRCWTPLGAFYAFANVEGLKERSIDGFDFSDGDGVSAYLLEKARIAVVPGSGFCAPGYIRWSYATSEAIIEAGMDRLKSVFSS
ncbi:MAG: pyridoxal phosphate-dependent aminotransferase [Fimbriimonadia bacterium]|nr:pyridoxal phosphate-dependent aminotransferase [Fimbriimonadia bacterium]